MSSKFSKRFMWLLMAAVFAVIAAGGCGGGSSRGGSDPSDSPVDPTPTPSDSPYRPPLTAPAELGLDSKGVPVLFRLLDRNADEQVITPDKKGDIGTEPEAVALEVPAQVKSVLRKPVQRDVEIPGLHWPDERDDLITASVWDVDRDVFSAELNGGVKYSVEVSKNLADSLGFMPIIEITNEKGEPVTDYELSVEPKEDPAVIVKTFTPKSDDRFIIRVSGDGHRGGASLSEIHYVLRVYAENGKNGESGHPTQFMIDKKPVSLRDTIMLRRAAMGSSWYDNEVSLIPVKNDFGFPKLNADSPRAKAFHAKLKAVEKSMSVGSGSDESTIEVTVTGIPWMTDMDNGAGYYAHTGKKAAGVAVQSFTLPEEIKHPATTYSSHFISTKEEHEKEMNIEAEASYSSGAFSIGASASYSDKIAYGLETTTLVIHYDTQDTEYNILDDINSYKLTDEAKQYLDEHGADGFRERYGDYFLSGRIMGARIDAYVILRTESSEEIEDIKAKLNGKYSGFEASASFAQSMKDTLQNTQAIVNIVTFGGQGSSNGESSVMYMDTDGRFKPRPTDASFTAPSLKMTPEVIDSTMESINNFITASQSSSFKLGTLSVRMDALSRLDTRIPTTIPVAQDCFVLSNQLMRELFGLTSYYCDVSSISDSNVIYPADTKTEWKNKYTNFVTKLNTNLDAVCASVDELNSSISDVQSLSKEFRDLSDRWMFYKMLMKAQAEQPQKRQSGMWDPSVPDYLQVVVDQVPGSASRTWGYFEFPLSATVDSDIKNSHKYDQTWSGGDSSESVHFPASDTCPSSQVWGGIKMSGTLSDCSVSGVSGIVAFGGVDNNYPTLGRGTLDWDCSVAPNVTWQAGLTLQAVDLSSDKYPFVGLQK